MGFLKGFFGFIGMIAMTIASIGLLESMNNNVTRRQQEHVEDEYSEENVGDEIDSEQELVEDSDDYEESYAENGYQQEDNSKKKATEDEDDIDYIANRWLYENKIPASETPKGIGLIRAQHLASIVGGSPEMYLGIPKEEAEKWEREIKHRHNIFQKEQCICKYCKYTWVTRKKNSLPAICPRPRCRREGVILFDEFYDEEMEQKETSDETDIYEKEDKHLDFSYEESQDKNEIYLRRQDKYKKSNQTTLKSYIFKRSKIYEENNFIEHFRRKDMTKKWSSSELSIEIHIPKKITDKIPNNISYEEAKNIGIELKRKNFNFKGEEVICRDCSKTWTTFKNKGLPVRCLECNSERIALSEKYRCVF